MLKANQAVRLGLRASSRNPELAFGKALLDQGGNLLALLPVLLIGLFLFALSSGEALTAVLRAAVALQRARWALAGASVAAAALSWVANVCFWSGAIPLLAADAEMNARPPRGNFMLLVGRGFGRVAPTAFVASALSTLSGVTFLVAFLAGIPALVLRPSARLAAGSALVLTTAVFASVLIDLLGRLMLVRSAAFADGVSAAFGSAARLLGARLGALLAITVAFLVLEIVAVTASAAIGGMLSGGLDLDPRRELLVLAPRAALAIAFAAVFAWIEVAKQAALAALAADDEGLLEPVVEAVPVEAIAVAEPVVEALPVPEDE